LHELIFYPENENFIKPFLEKIQIFLNKNEILSLIFAQESKLNETSFMFACRKKFKDLKVFWNFLDENLNETEKKEILLAEQKGLITALQYSTFNQDRNSFLFIKEIYEKFFTSEKVREIFKKTSDYFISFLHNTIIEASTQTALEVSKYLENLFKNEKIELRKILSHRNVYGDSIFSELKDKNEFEGKFKIFIQLLRKTFDENENEEFEKNKKNLQEKNTNFQSLNFFRDFSERAQNFEVLRSTYWTTGDFKFFVEDFGEIRTNFSYEILRKNLLDNLNLNFLHSLTLFNYNEDFVEPFLEKIQKVLNKSEFVILILAQDNSDRSSLMHAAWKTKLENLKVFWNLIEKNLNEEERKKLLMIEDQGWWTALQSSTINQDPNSFLFMTKIYEKFFTQEEIRSILLKHNPQYAPFISNIISYASLETALEVSKYLENLFKNEKLELRKILSHRASGRSIFSFHKDKTEDEEKLKVFTELLRKTFEEDPVWEFRNFLRELEIFRPIGYFR
jgi:hypothetical protein